MPDAPPLKLFIIYAREDQPALLELKAHLRPLENRGDLTVWYEGEILPGQDRSIAIKAQLERADVVLLCISKYFFSSEYIESEELKLAIERHKKGEIVVVPVIVKPCLWESYPVISNLQVLPKDGKAVSSWREVDEAYTDVVRGLQRLLKKSSSQIPEQEMASTRTEESEITAAKVEEGCKAFIAKDFHEAFRLLSKYCNTEYTVNLDGYVKLGFMYQNGLGVEQDFYEAIKWFRKAAHQGNANGKNNLGFMYQNGYGVVEDHNEAVKWYREAAKQGLSVAKDNLKGLGYAE